MIFGNKKRFGIEYELNSDYGREWLFGRVCYWVHDNQIGDYELGTSLRDVLFVCERMVHDANKRENTFLWNLNTVDLIDTLAEGLIHADLEDDVSKRSVEEQWARHNILPNLDVFNDWLVYIIEQGGSARCVSRNLISRLDNSYSLSYGEFDTVLGATVESLRDHYERAVRLL